MSSSSQSTSPSPSRKRKRDSKSFLELEVDITAPEPRSKKALRRAKKGKPVNTSAEKPILDSSDESKSESEEDTAETATSPQRSEYGIWIGNLPWTATKVDVQSLFTRDRGIEDADVTRIYMPGPSQATIDASRQRVKPQNKGFAYVDFVNGAAHKAAIGLSESLLAGRRVLIKDAKNFEGRPVTSKEGIKTEPGNPPSKRIFVGNLHFDTSQEELREHFAKCGDIATVFVATFEDSGKCKGYAWVTFEDIPGAEKAVRGWVEWEDDGTDETEDDSKVKKKKKPRKWWVNRIKGRQLRMEFAEDQSVRYKKRFGRQKESTEHATEKQDGVRGEEEAMEKNGRKLGRNDNPGTGKRDGEKPRANSRFEKKSDARTTRPGTVSTEVQRLTGAIVQSTGKKIVFD